MAPALMVPVGVTGVAVHVKQAEEIVPVGALDPNQIHVPGAFVHRVVHGTHYEKRIEVRPPRAPGLALVRAVLKLKTLGGDSRRPSWCMRWPCGAEWGYSA